MKLAHFSDVHVTHFPLSESFALKRLAAVASYSLAGRAARFINSDSRIEALLRSIDTAGIEHSICTGDLTGVSTEAEFTRAGQLFGPRLEQPARFSVLPGNHDRYIAKAKGLFEHHFGRLCEGGHFPVVKRIGEHVTLVMVDSARPTSLVDSSGLVGEAQRSKLLSILTDGSLKTQFVIVALHYGLMKMSGRRDSRSHGLRDDVEVTQLLDRDDVTVDLVLHGHLHRSFVQRTKRRHIINAGSATDLHVDCGFNVLDIDVQRWSVKLERCSWNPSAAAYEVAASHAMNRTIVTR